MTRLALLILGAWCITYHLSLGLLGEGLREKVRIFYSGGDRVADNRLGQFVNCPTCTALLSMVIMLILDALGLDYLVLALGVSGGVTIIGRWWVSQRPRAEWWL